MSRPRPNDDHSRRVRVHVGNLVCGEGFGHCRVTWGTSAWSLVSYLLPDIRSAAFELSAKLVQQKTLAEIEAVLLSLIEKVRTDRRREWHSEGPLGETAQTAQPAETAKPTDG